MSSDQFGFVAERPFSRTPLAVVPASPVTDFNSAEQPAADAPLTFDQLGLTPELLKTIAAQGYTEPTPVQARSIPIVLSGRDILAGAQTGTGKTAAFVLPILQLLNASRPAVRYIPAGRARRRGESGLPIRCLVLTPTRELALQIEESCRTYGGDRPADSTTIYGGVGFNPQVRALKAGPEIVVATPGRLLDHAGQGTIDLSNVEILVLDEADRMLDMGFIKDIRRIIELLPVQRQNLMFSATFSNDIRDLASGILRDPAFVQISRPNAPIELVRQVVYPVDRERKRELLSHLIKTGRIDRALVFTRTKHGANRLAEQLCMDGILATAIHGNKSQGQRVKALDDFKEGKASILVATEVASRGIDIDALPHVVNFELPMVAQDYVHRIGRTGRAGLEGDAVSLVCIDENMLMADIESLLRTRITREVVEGFEVNKAIPREPILQRNGGAHRSDTRRQAPNRRPVQASRPFPAARPIENQRPFEGTQPEVSRSYDAAPRPMAGPRPMASPRPFEPRPFEPRRAAEAPRQFDGPSRQFDGPRPAETRRPAASARPYDARRQAPSGPRRPDFNRYAASDDRQAAPTGFNQSQPVEPRYAPGGFRRPFQSDFTPTPSGRSDARRPAQGGSRAGTSSGYAPVSRPSYGRPSSGGGYARPASGPRPSQNARQGGERGSYPAAPGERVARRDDRRS
jgi:ATP-dependent RNA helicase RhlE